MTKSSALTDEQLLEGLGFLYGENYELSYKSKIVKIRKFHDCRYFCHGREQTSNRPGTRMVRETCIIPEEGWLSCYTCLECCEKGYYEIPEYCRVT